MEYLPQPKPTYDEILYVHSNHLFVAIFKIFVRRANVNPIQCKICVFFLSIFWNCGGRLWHSMEVAYNNLMGELVWRGWQGLARGDNCTLICLKACSQRLPGWRSSKGSGSAFRYSSVSLSTSSEILQITNINAPFEVTNKAFDKTQLCALTIFFCISQPIFKRRRNLFVFAQVQWTHILTWSRWSPGLVCPPVALFPIAPTETWAQPWSPHWPQPPLPSPWLEEHRWSDRYKETRTERESWCGHIKALQLSEATGVCCPGTPFNAKRCTVNSLCWGQMQLYKASVISPDSCVRQQLQAVNRWTTFRCAALAESICRFERNLIAKFNIFSFIWRQKLKQNRLIGLFFDHSLNISVERLQNMRTSVQSVI